MKRTLKQLLISALLVVAPLFLLAQAPPLPGDPKDGTEVGGEPPAGAPIGNGTLILLTLAAAYAGRKVYVIRTEKEEVTV